MFIRRRLLCLFVGILCLSPLGAEVQMVLLSGQTIVGDILFENEDVVILKTDDGARYQYLRKDIASVSRIMVQSQDTLAQVRSVKKVGLALQVMGGVAVLPRQTVGGFVAADLKLGACNLLGRGIFLGGAVGYHAFLLNGENIGFIPLQICTEIPFLQGKHAPYAGLGVGYGFAVAKSYHGGAFCNAELGWRCQLKPNMVLSLSCYSEFQQGVFPVSENINGMDYTRKTVLGICNVGAKFGVGF